MLFKWIFIIDGGIFFISISDNWASIELKIFKFKLMIIDDTLGNIQWKAFYNKSNQRMTSFTQNLVSICVSFINSKGKLICWFWMKIFE